MRNEHLRDPFYSHLARPDATKSKMGRIGHGQGRIGHGQGRIGQIQGRIRRGLGRISGENRRSGCSAAWCDGSDPALRGRSYRRACCLWPTGANSGSLNLNTWKEFGSPLGSSTCLPGSVIVRSFARAGIAGKLRSKKKGKKGVSHQKWVTWNLLKIWWLAPFPHDVAHARRGPHRAACKKSTSRIPRVCEGYGCSGTPTGSRATSGFWPRDAKSASTRHRIRHTRGRSSARAAGLGRRTAARGRGPALENRPPAAAAAVLIPAASASAIPADASFRRFADADNRPSVPQAVASPPPILDF